MTIALKTIVGLSALLILVSQSVGCGLTMEAGLKQKTRNPSVLATAAEHGDLAGVQAILSRHPELVNETGTDDQTALMLAASKGYNEITQVLLEAGADPNVREKHYNQTALQLAALEGYAEIVELILESGGDPNAAREDGYTPLMFAAWSLKPNTRIVRALLDKGADITLKEFEGHTALDIAKIRRYEDIVEILVAAEAKKK